MGIYWSEGTKLQFCKMNECWDLTYSTVNAVNNIIVS